MPRDEKSQETEKPAAGRMVLPRLREFPAPKGLEEEKQSAYVGGSGRLTPGVPIAGTDDARSRRD